MLAVSVDTGIPRPARLEVRSPAVSHVPYIRVCWNPGGREHARPKVMGWLPEAPVVWPNPAIHLFYESGRGWCGWGLLTTDNSETQASLLPAFCQTPLGAVMRFPRGIDRWAWPRRHDLFVLGSRQTRMPKSLGRFSSVIKHLHLYYFSDARAGSFARPVKIGQSDCAAGQGIMIDHEQR